MGEEALPPSPKFPVSYTLELYVRFMTLLKEYLHERGVSIHIIDHNNYRHHYQRKNR